MKRLIAVIMIVAVLAVGFAAVADPIGVGGTFTSSSSSFTHFPGKGMPHGKPFAPQIELLLSPIGVGGT
jgi:hypothetical protein